jgi:hypothetical protein
MLNGTKLSLASQLPQGARVRQKTLQELAASEEAHRASAKLQAKINPEQARVYFMP